MKDIKNLRYQLDVVTTLIDNAKENYILWIDTEDRMIETNKGINRQITNNYELTKICNLFHYPIEDVVTN